MTIISFLFRKVPLLGSRHLVFDVFFTVRPVYRLWWISYARDLLINFSRCMFGSNWRERLMTLLLSDINHIYVTLVSVIINNVITKYIILYNNCRSLIIPLQTNLRLWDKIIAAIIGTSDRLLVMDLVLIASHYCFASEHHGIIILRKRVIRKWNSMDLVRRKV